MLTLLALGGGAVIGYLARQPEINRLKKQIQLLQKENERLRSCIDAQNRTILEYKVRYNALKAWQFSEKRKVGSSARSRVMQQCCLMEYLEISITKVQGKELSEEMLVFYNIYELMLSGKENTLTVNEFRVLKNYIYCRYRSEIETLTPPDISKTQEKLERCHVA